MVFVHTAAVQPSATQIRMLALCAQGLSREEIGRRLCLSPWTVKTYLDDLRGQLGKQVETDVRNVTQAVAICIVMGHLQIDPVNRCVTAAELELQPVVAAVA